MPSYRDITRVGPKVYSYTKVIKVCKYPSLCNINKLGIMYSKLPVSKSYLEISKIHFFFIANLARIRKKYEPKTTKTL